MSELKTKLEAIKTEKEKKILSENIKSGITVFGVSGNVTELNGQEKIVSPIKTDQDITPDEQYNALTKVTVKAVKSDIDSNIQPENIKSGISILGIEGTLKTDIPFEKEEEYTELLQLSKQILGEE